MTLQGRVAPVTGAGFRIGCVGAGFIMREVHLEAYARAGFDVVAIASRTPARAREVAAARGIPRAYDTYQELLADPAVEILDVAFPPHLQPDVVREAVRHAAARGGHLKGILAQKPLAVTLDAARDIVERCAAAGLTLAVNQNMRYDHSIRALKGLIVRGTLGTPIIATIDMHARPHWQAFLREYGRLALLNMSIHHLDCFRFLFGEPERVLTSVRPDPRTDFPHTDGLALYVLEYTGGLRAAAWDNAFTWADDAAITWRVEGTDGTARGTIGWPDYPAGSPSTIDYTLRAEPGVWHRPRWEERWFPDAFAGPMAQLMRAVEAGTEPEIGGRDNLRTLALVEACYRSAEEGRAVAPDEVFEP